MKKALSVCSFEIKRTLSKPSAFILMLVLPIVFTLIFGSVFNNSSSQAFTLAIVDKDKSHVSSVFVKRLKQNHIFKIKQTDSKKSTELMKSHSIDGIVTIEKGFQEQLTTKQNSNVRFQYPPGSQSSTIIKQTLNQEIKRIKLQEISAIEWGKTSNKNWLEMFDKLSSSDRKTNELTKIVAGNDSTKSLSGVSYSSAGFSIMFVMIMMMSVTGVIIEAKNTGVWSRLLTTSITKFQLLLGYLLAFFVIGWIQFGILMTFSSIAFHVEWGNILGLAALISSLLLCVVGLGLAIASIVKTTEQQTAIGTLIIVSTCMLGGVYWPLNIVPDIMQKIANFVPQSWAMKGFTSLIVEGGSLPDILTPISILLIFAVVFLSFGLFRVRVS